LFADETVRDAGQVNPRDNFAYVFDPKFEELVMNRMDRNNEQVVKFLEDPQLKNFYHQSVSQSGLRSNPGRDEKPH
jgi:hypothetical protein